MNFKFPKTERLTSEKEIEALFRTKNKLTVFPFKVLWLENEKSLHQILISCPKRNLKKAVDRNLIKRRVRESYRLNKHQLYNEDITFFNIAFIYIGNEILEYTVINEKLVKAIDKLKEELLKNE